MKERSEQETEQAGDDKGAWVTPPVSYVDPQRRFCALCGRPIARRYWREGQGSSILIYCDPAHAVLHATYPVKIERQG